MNGTKSIGDSVLREPTEENPDRFLDGTIDIYPNLSFWAAADDRKWKYVRLKDVFL
jgi:hypothetical protein